MVSGLKYVGRFTPASDFFVATKGFTDAYWDSVRVDNTYIDAQMVTLLSTLNTASFVDTRDATKAKKTYVDSQDALYVPYTQRAVAGGVAPVNDSIQVPAINVPPGILTDRVATALNPTLIISGPHTVTDQNNSQEYLAATLDIADPGYPYLPLIFGQVMGTASNATNPGDGQGLGTYGQAIVFDSSNNAWGRAVTASNFRTRGFPIKPWALSGQTPMTLTGATQLSLYMSLFSQAPATADGYTFTNTGLSFWALIVPGI